MDCFGTYTLRMSQSVIMCLLEERLNGFGWQLKSAIPLPLGAASLLLATQHTYLKKQHIFLFIGTLVCLVFIGFYNRFSHGGQYLGVVTRSRAQFNIWSFFVPKNVPDLFTTFLHHLTYLYRYTTSSVSSPWIDLQTGLLRRLHHHSPGCLKSYVANASVRRSKNTHKRQTGFIGTATYYCCMVQKSQGQPPFGCIKPCK